MSGSGTPHKHAEVASLLDAHEVIEDFFQRTGRYPNQDSLHIAYCSNLWEAVHALRKVRECILTEQQERQTERVLVNRPEYRPK